jgi:uncharacterized protein (DUF736 family)
VASHARLCRELRGFHVRKIVVSRRYPDATIAGSVSGSKHVHCGLDGACLTEDRRDRLGSTGICNGRIVFFPWRLRSHSSRSQESLSLAVLHWRFGPLGAGPPSPVLSTAIEIAMTRLEQPQGRNATMATIGTFTTSGNGFSGIIKTLNLNVKATMRAVERATEKGPDFRILARNVEFGAAWKKVSNDGRDYLSVKLDDPSFPGPIFATLIEVDGEEGLSLIWSRSNRD